MKRGAHLKAKIAYLFLTMQLYIGRFRLFGYALLIEACVGIGDVTIFLAFPELFVYALLLSLAIIIWKKCRPYLAQIILKKSVLLTPTLWLFSCAIFLNHFIWFQPY
mgnify:FL=1